MQKKKRKEVVNFPLSKSKHTPPLPPPKNIIKKEEIKKQQHPHPYNKSTASK